MHDLPDTIFTPKDARNPQSHWRDIRLSSNLGPVTLYLDDVSKVGSRILCYGFEAAGLAVSVMRCGAIHGLSNLLPSARERAKGVTEGCVFSLREQLLGRIRVSFHELTPR